MQVEICTFFDLLENSYFTCKGRPSAKKRNSMRLAFENLLSVISCSPCCLYFCERICTSLSKACSQSRTAFQCSSSFCRKGLHFSSADLLPVVNRISILFVFLPEGFVFLFYKRPLNQKPLFHAVCTSAGRICTSCLKACSHS